MAGDHVFNGFWINWEDGRTKGATLTLPTYQGLVLVSFLTLYVQFSGVCFWRVVCFILHQVRSTTNLRDGLFHQQQAILRNAITAPSALWSFALSALAWKSRANAAIRNSMPLLLIATLHISFFAAAGLLSSRATTTQAGQALVRKAKCGFAPELSDPLNTESLTLSADELRLFNTEVLLGRLTLTKSSYYVRTCYNDDTNSAVSTCNSYLQPHLMGVNASAVSNATCPFGDNACATDFAARYDSGYIHSGQDLGINLPNDESLSMRRVTTCAPIRDDGAFSTEWRDGVPETIVGRSNTSVKHYEFGKGRRSCEATNDTTDFSTFCVSEYQKENIQAAYTVRGVSSYDGNNGTASNFNPIPAFRVPKADTTLISILSRANYAGEVLDPLFHATNRSAVSDEFFQSTNDLDVLGCTEQYQFCNLGNDRCTDLAGLYAVGKAVERGDLDLNTRQNATYTLMWKSAWAMGLQWSVEILSDNILLAKDWVFTAKSKTSSSLPDNQWQLETYNMHNLSLAVFQRRINEFARPESFEISPGQNSLGRIVEPEEPELLALCSLQKIRSSDHYSVSVLGMSIILIVGGVLILLDWVLVQQIFWFRSITHARQAKKADWTNTGLLQLYRQALEARHIGPWNTKNYEFPTLVARNQTFTGLGVQPDPSIQLGPMNSGWVGDGKDGTAYNGGRYTALSPTTPGIEEEMHTLGDSKAHRGQS